MSRNRYLYYLHYWTSPNWFQFLVIYFRNTLYNWIPFDDVFAIYLDQYNCINLYGTHHQNISWWSWTYHFDRPLSIPVVDESGRQLRRWLRSTQKHFILKSKNFPSGVLFKFPVWQWPSLFRLRKKKEVKSKPPDINRMEIRAYWGPS